MERVIDYYFAPHSPWAFLGHARFVALCDRVGAVARVKPCDFGRIFAASGGLPLGKRAPQRQSYRLLELARYGKSLDLPIHVQPKFFPVAPDLAALRIVAAAELLGDRAASTLAGGIMTTVWIDEGNIADEDTLDRVAVACGFDAAALREAAGSPATQDRIDALTAEAIAAEVFGAPTYIPRFGPAQGQRFWGQDRLDLLEDAVAGR